MQTSNVVNNLAQIFFALVINKRCQILLQIFYISLYVRGLHSSTVIALVALLLQIWLIGATGLVKQINICLQMHGSDKSVAADQQIIICRSSLRSNTPLSLLRCFHKPFSVIKDLSPFKATKEAFAVIKMAITTAWSHLLPRVCVCGLPDEDSVHISHKVHVT